MTPRPWHINGKTDVGWRIDSLADDKTGFEFLMNPVALVLEKEDAELIVRLANEEEQKAPVQGEGDQS